MTTRDPEPREPNNAMGELRARIAELEESYKALQVNESRMRRMIEDHPDFIVRHDGDGQISFANRAYCEYFRTPRSSIVGKSFLPRVHESDRAAIREKLAKLSPENPQAADVHRAILPTGEVRWQHWIDRAIYDRSGRLVEYQSVGRDISGLRAAQESLELSEAILSQMPDAILVTGLDGRIQRWLGNAEVVFGFSVAEALGQPATFCIRPDQQARFARLIAQSLEENNRFSGELPCVRKDGSEIVVETTIQVIHSPDGEPVARVGVNRDVTRRKEAEEALKASELRLAEAQSLARIGSWEWQLTRSEVKASRQLLRMLGASETTDTMTHEEFLAYIHAEDVKQVRKLAQNTIDRMEPFEFTHRIQRSDGTVRMFAARGRVVLNAHGVPDRLIGTSQDITDQVQAELDRKHLEARILQAQKLESLGVLAGGIAHEFNNLLVGVLGNADLALMDLPPDSPARRSIEQIEVSARRAADLTRQMLAYSGKGKFVIDRVDLNTLINEMRHLLEASINKRAFFKLRLEDGIDATEGDISQIRHLIMNLVVNAAEAIGANGGIITLTTGSIQASRAYLDGTYFAELLPEGKYVYVEISDTGCGMDRETLSRVFDPFFTTKFTGRGLGLAASLGIVRAHSGAVKVYSEVGKGTSFKVLFPVLQSKDAADAPMIVEHLERQRRSDGLILVVDDEDSVRALAKEMLERAGYSVVTAPGGREAIELFGARKYDVRAVLLDMTMPFMDGEQTFHALRQIDPDVKVVLTSGYNEQDATNAFGGKGLAGFIQKPYQSRQLLEIIREVAGRQIT